MHVRISGKAGDDDGKKHVGRLAHCRNAKLISSRLAHFTRLDPDQGGHSRRCFLPAASIRIEDVALSIRTTATAEDRANANPCKAPPGSQYVLVNADPKRFYVPPYVGHKGWVGVRLDRRPDWDEVARIVRRSYQLVAPKRLAASA